MNCEIELPESNESNESGKYVWPAVRERIHMGAKIYSRDYDAIFKEEGREKVYS